MDEPSASLALAERVAAAAQQLGIDTCLIGAAALAVHNYVRGTHDVDLATAIDPFTQLRALERALSQEGLRTSLRLPDDDDPLGGVLVVWERDDEDGSALDPIEVVNFDNPHHRRPNPARAAIRNATRLDDRSVLRCVRLPDLVALKLYAGALRDHADIVELLARNDADLDEIRAAAAPYDADHRLEELIALAAAQRARRPTEP